MIRELFDTNWNDLSKYVIPSGQAVTPKPSILERMLEVTGRLSTDFPFVRVDLYEVNGKIYFGELTFSPASGVFSSYSDEFIAEMGKKLKI